jgi:hypothetical protein
VGALVLQLIFAANFVTKVLLEPRMECEREMSMVLQGVRYSLDRDEPTPLGVHKTICGDFCSEHIELLWELAEFFDLLHFGFLRVQASSILQENCILNYGLIRQQSDGPP